MRSQTETSYVQTEMNARRGCRAFKITRSGNTDERTMVWTWTHDGLDMNARWSGHERTKVWTWTHEKFSCVHFQTFVRSCPDHRAVMSRPSCVHVQTIVRSCPDFRAFTRRKKILPAGVHCRSLKLKTERVPKLHKSRYLKSFFYVRNMNIFILIVDIVFCWREQNYSRCLSISIKNKMNL